MGLLERTTRNAVSRVRLRVLKGTKRPELHGHIYQNVEAGSAVITDALKSCNGLERAFTHAVIDHVVCYV